MVASTGTGSTSSPAEPPPERSWRWASPGSERRVRHRLLLSAGFALGAGLAATQNGFSRELSAFLVGSILTVSSQDLLGTAVVLAAVSTVLLAGARALLFTGFDP